MIMICDLFCLFIALACTPLETRNPCCRRELPRDAGHLYRKLALNPGAMPWIETSQKLSANMGKLSKNHFTSASVKDWRMSPHGITGPLNKVNEIRGISFNWLDPLTRPNFVALRQKVCEISLVEKSAPRKSSAKFILSQQICHQYRQAAHEFL